MSDQTRKQRAGSRAVLLFIALTVLSACISDGLSTPPSADTADAPTTPIALGENGRITVVEDCSDTPRSGRVIEILNEVTLSQVGELESNDAGFAGFLVMSVESPNLPCRYLFTSGSRPGGLFHYAFGIAGTAPRDEIDDKLDEMLQERTRTCQRRIFASDRCRPREVERLEAESVLFNLWTSDGTSPMRASALILTDEIFFESGSH